MGAVVGLELAQNVRHVPLDGILADGKLSGDLFVGVTARDQTQHFQFALAQRINEQGSSGAGEQR